MGAAATTATAADVVEDSGNHGGDIDVGVGVGVGDDRLWWWNGSSSDSSGVGSNDVGIPTKCGRLLISP